MVFVCRIGVNDGNKTARILAIKKLTIRMDENSRHYQSVQAAADYHETSINEIIKWLCLLAPALIIRVDPHHKARGFRYPYQVPMESESLEQYQQRRQRLPPPGASGHI